MNIRAYAKINIGLDVLRRRPDGYHEVRMIMQTIGLHDELSIEKDDKPGIRIETDRDDLPVNNDNLIFKAAQLMMDEYGIDGGINVRLSKNIPVAAGLAGGSTDAAATLIAMNDLFELGLDTHRLCDMGVRIGADVPYCIIGGTALSEGIGEILTPISPCPYCRIVLAKPPVDVSTAYVYKHLQTDKAKHPDIDAVISGIENKDIRSVARSMGNVLESVTIPANPVISDIKEMMTRNRAIVSMMSGSGPTVFGLFDNEDGIDEAYGCIKSSGLAPELFKTEIYPNG